MMYFHSNIFGDITNITISDSILLAFETLGSIVHRYRGFTYIITRIAFVIVSYANGVVYRFNNALMTFMILDLIDSLLTSYVTANYI